MDIHPLDVRLGMEVAQGAGGLHQGAADEGAAGHVGREGQRPGDGLGVELPLPRHHQACRAALKQGRFPPEAAEHPVVAVIAAALVQGHGEEDASREAVQAVCDGVGDALRRGLQLFSQRLAVLVFRQDDGHVSPSLRSVWI